jgi:hypothetical protein
VVIPQQLAANHPQRIREPLVLNAAVEQFDLNLPVQFELPRIRSLEAAAGGEGARGPQQSHHVARAGIDQRGQQFFVQRNRPGTVELHPACRILPGVVEFAEESDVLTGWNAAAEGCT